MTINRYSFSIFIAISSSLSVCNANAFDSTTTMLKTSTNELALSVSGLTNGPFGPAVESGNPRQIIITNSGKYPTENLFISLPKWPLGTKITSNTCPSNLQPKSSCQLTITPGRVASSDGVNPCSIGSSPLPGVIEIGASNSNIIKTRVFVMDYGCIYQGGYIFAIDDLTSTSTSIGGKVLATSEQSQALLWGDTLDKFEGIDENSTSGANSCNGATDGLCNSRRILASGLKPPAAVKACEQLNDSGFNDWYLPAICEMGYDTYNHSSHCGSKTNPSLQNFTSTLYDNKRANMPVAEYWSSTQFSGAPDFAWLHFTLNSGQDYEFKKFDYQVRCVRHLSNEK